MKDDWAEYWGKDSWLEKIINWYKSKYGYAKLINAVNPQGHYSLEVGAGKAQISIILKDKGWFAYACDNDTATVVFNRDNVDRYFHRDATNLMFPGNHFDLAFSCGLLEHLRNGEASETLNEMKRVSKHVAVMFPSCNWLWRLVWKIRGVPDGRIPKLLDFNHMTKKVVKLFGLFDYIIYESSSSKPTTKKCCSGCNS